MTTTPRRRCRHSSHRVRLNQILPNRFSGRSTLGSLDFRACSSNEYILDQSDISPIEASLLPAWKRASDIALVLLILPLIAFFAAIVYCWIQFVSPGSVLFRQTRIGRGGKPFTIFKFRTMKPLSSMDVHEAHVEHLIKSNLPMIKLDRVGDSRLLKGGCFIRNAGLDELPQFINVLRGEMSLVGPRPCLPNEFELYEKSQRCRFAVQPGLTGHWQVNRTDAMTFSDMVCMDDDYVNRQSPLMDLRIILKTPLVLLKQLQACSKSKSGKVVRRPVASSPSRELVS